MPEWSLGIVEEVGEGRFAASVACVLRAGPARRLGQEICDSSSELSRIPDIFHSYRLRRSQNYLTAFYGLRELASLRVRESSACPRSGGRNRHGGFRSGKMLGAHVMGPHRPRRKIFCARGCRMQRIDLPSRIEEALKAMTGGKARCHFDPVGGEISLVALRTSDGGDGTWLSASQGKNSVLCRCNIVFRRARALIGVARAAAKVGTGNLLAQLRTISPCRSKTASLEPPPTSDIPLGQVARSLRSHKFKAGHREVVVEVRRCDRCVLEQVFARWPANGATAPAARLLVNGSFAAPGFNTKVVNRSAPDLFPVMSLVKNQFTRRESEERRAFDLTGNKCC